MKCFYCDREITQNEVGRRIEVQWWDTENEDGTEPLCKECCMPKRNK